MITKTVTLKGTPTKLGDLLGYTEDQKRIFRGEVVDSYAYIYSDLPFDFKGSNSLSETIEYSKEQPLVIQSWDDILNCEFSKLGVEIQIIIQ